MRRAAGVVPEWCPDTVPQCQVFGGGRCAGVYTLSCSLGGIRGRSRLTGGVRPEPSMAGILSRPDLLVTHIQETFLHFLGLRQALQDQGVGPRRDGACARPIP